MPAAFLCFMNRICIYLVLTFLFLSLSGLAQPGSKSHKLFLGGDFSYVNELEDCGGKYRFQGKEKDPFVLFAASGCSVSRVRIWHNATWTRYSGIQDVKRTIRRSKAAGMRVMLDFHYSDTWTDPARQTIPSAWKTISDPKILGDSLYLYTRSVLMQLHAEGLLPDLVQVGNEINAEILQPGEPVVFPINWPRNVLLLNRGIEAVKEVSALTKNEIGTILHIAQPDEAFAWFEKAKENGIANYDWIGLSYYTQWSKFNLSQLAAEITKLKKTFKKRVMIVEAGYPFTLQNTDSASNLLDTVSQLPGYTISVSDQKRFMTDLIHTIVKAGGEGMIYWEPAWISTNCRTQWARGSHWDNATFFDPARNNEALPVFDIFREEQYLKK